MVQMETGPKQGSTQLSHCCTVQADPEATGEAHIHIYWAGSASLGQPREASHSCGIRADDGAGTARHTWFWGAEGQSCGRSHVVMERATEKPASAVLSAGDAICQLPDMM